jgi:N-dimethylarginine dimethylaminohydrolase
MGARDAGRQKILMCPPDFFSVDYVINPWMAGNEGTLDVELAKAQWETLRAGLSTYADVELFDPQPNLPDLVFTANAGFVSGNKVVPSHFMPHERRPEEPYLKQWFADKGYELHVLPDDVGFEGAGDCLLDRSGPWLWTGYGFRTEIESHRFLAEWFDREVVSIRLIDSRFYHIDTCFCPLSGGYLMYHPDAFDDDSVAAIEARVPADKRLCVSADDAGNFACNAVNVDDQVFAHRMSAGLKTRLAEAGFAVHEIALSEFLKAGGSAKCLTLKLTEPETGTP